MKRWSAWALALAATGFWVFELGSAARSAQQDNRARLTIASPKDNASVKETVRVLVPKTAVQEDGFVSVYVDGRFRAAVAPPLVWPGLFPRRAPRGAAPRPPAWSPRPAASPSPDALPRRRAARSPRS